MGFETVWVEFSPKIISTILSIPNDTKFNHNLGMLQFSEVCFIIVKHFRLYLTKEPSYTELCVLKTFAQSRFAGELVIKVKLN